MEVNEVYKKWHMIYNSNSKRRLLRRNEKKEEEEYIRSVMI